MNVLNNWMKKIFANKVVFNNLENLILQKVRKEIDNSEVALLWDKQILDINKIQRVLNRESNFYRKKNGQITFNDEYRFPNTKEELLIAKLKIKFSAMDKEHSLLAKVWSVRGFLFSIEYGKDFSELEKLLSTLNNSEVDMTCKILGDLSLSNNSTL